MGFCGECCIRIGIHDRTQCKRNSSMVLHGKWAGHQVFLRNTTWVGPNSRRTTPPHRGLGRSSVPIEINLTTTPLGTSCDYSPIEVRITLQLTLPGGPVIVARPGTIDRMTHTLQAQSRFAPFAARFRGSDIQDHRPSGSTAAPRRLLRIALLGGDTACSHSPTGEPAGTAHARASVHH